MSILDGFWFQVGRGFADLMMAAMMFVCIMVIGALYVAINVAIEAVKGQKRK